jgi:hypothetical protein
MLKMVARVTRNGKPVHVVVLGLSSINIAKLKEGQPIRFNGTEVGLASLYGEDTEVMIFSGDTERSMGRELAEFIGLDTKVSISPKLVD